MVFVFFMSRAPEAHPVIVVLVETSLRRGHWHSS